MKTLIEDLETLATELDQFGHEADAKHAYLGAPYYASDQAIRAILASSKAVA